MKRGLFGALIAAAVATTLVIVQGAQDDRQASPDGNAAAQVGGTFVPGPVGPIYSAGKWIEILYGRRLKRGRDVLGGSGPNYGKIAIAGGAGYAETPVWRAGACVTIRPTNQRSGAAFNYTPDKDVVRAKMTLTTLPVSVEELTWAFVDMTDGGGKIALMWDTDLATVPFKVQTTNP